jgi:hypothetical protein
VLNDVREYHISELERTDKEPVMDHFKLLSQHLPERTDKNHDNPQNSQYIGRYMNQMSLQYKKHCSLHQLTQFCAEQSLLAEVCNIFKVKQREFLYAAFYEDFKILPTVCCCMKYNVSKKIMMGFQEALFPNTQKGITLNVVPLNSSSQTFS